MGLGLVGKGGLEPPRLSAHDPKSLASDNNRCRRVSSSGILYLFSAPMSAHHNSL